MAPTVEGAGKLPINDNHFGGSRRRTGYLPTKWWTARLSSNQVRIGIKWWRLWQIDVLFLRSRGDLSGRVDSSSLSLWGTLGLAKLVSGTARPDKKPEVDDTITSEPKIQIYLYINGGGDDLLCQKSHCCSKMLHICKLLPVTVWVTGATVISIARKIRLHQRKI